MTTQASPGDVPAWVDDLEDVADRLFRVPEHWPRVPKVVHDAVWGTRRFEPWEVAIIDLPAVQRLRRIHQTSLALLTYPTAVHTRFDHSLGVASIAKEMLDELERAGDAIEPFVSRAISAAALLHDIGHGPFSHLSEEAYWAYDGLFKGLLYLPGVHNGGLFPAAKPHEAVGALLLRTEAAKAFFAALNAEYDGLDLQPIELGDVIANNPTPRLGGYSDVVNGDFDADKIDYMHRDAHFSGLPIAIDLHRLLYALRIAEGPERPVVALSIQGSVPAEQILFGKATLFAALYHHHKVRASDCAFKSATRVISREGIEFCGRELASPADFLRLTDADFLSTNIRVDHPVVQQHIRKFVNRHLPVRCVELAQDTTEGDTQELWRLRDFTYYHAHDVYQEVERLRQAILDAASTSEDIELEDVWLDLPYSPKLGGGYLVKADETLVPLAEIFPTKKWGDFYKTHRYRAHVFGPRGVRDKVGEAARAVLEDQLHVFVNDPPA